MVALTDLLTQPVVIAYVALLNMFNASYGRSRSNVAMQSSKIDSVSHLQPSTVRLSYPTP
jgi:hypothetical protein